MRIVELTLNVKLELLKGDSKIEGSLGENVNLI